jgi:hypothetical protein
VGEELQIEAGAAGDDGSFSTGLDFSDDGCCEVDVILGISGFGGLENSVKVMGDLCLFHCGRGGTEDFEALVKLEGVGVDDLAVELKGILDGEAAFS